MPFTKGASGNSEGRPKGRANKTTAELRQIIQTIVEKNIKTIQTDLLALEPHDRLRIIIQLAEFAIPKMQRIEIKENHYQDEESENYIILSNGERIEF
jgi:Family of unknown function (DUF5681)